MPRVVVTERAVRGLKRCRNFLASKDQQAAKRAGRAIERQFALLESNPEIGRPFTDQPELRELIVKFGDSGYIALYRYEETADAVYLLAFRHQKEAGYGMA